MPLFHYVVIGCGGALGAISRVTIARVLPEFILGFPIYILLVNIIGCFIMGLVTEIGALYISISENMRLFLISGFLGGFTTFSAFSLEFVLLCQKNQFFMAFIYASLSFLLSIAAFFIGMVIIRM